MTGIPEVTKKESEISTHTPLAGRDEVSCPQMIELFKISTHTPLAGRDTESVVGTMSGIIISTHTPLAGRDGSESILRIFHAISTHTPLAGRDKKLREFLDE